MHVENFSALFQVGQFDIDLPVETSGTHQRFVEDIGPVRRSEHDHPCIRSETVHLGKQLVQGIFPLVVRRKTHVFTPGTADRIDLVDKDDARGFFLGLAEQVAYTRSPDADEHLDKVGTADRKERHVRFTGNSLG